MAFIGFICSLLVVVLFSIIPFLINPILGVVWVLWLVGVAIFTIKRNKGDNE